MGTSVAPSSDNLLLGAGEIWLNRFNAAGQPTGLRHLGNCETIELTTEDDVLTKYESMTRSRSLYKRVTRRRTPTLRIKMDEFTPFNLALVTMGTVGSNAAQLATTITAEPAAATTVPGTYFQTARLGPITGVSVQFGAVAGTLYNETTGLGDYRITNPDVGIIQIVPTSTKTGAVTVSYTPTAYAAGAIVTLNGGTESQIQGSILFIGDPASGPRIKCEFWKVSIAPDGAVGLISDDFAQIGITAAVQSDVKGNPLNPLYKLTYLPALPVV